MFGEKVVLLEAFARSLPRSRGPSLLWAPSRGGEASFEISSSWKDFVPQSLASLLALRIFSEWSQNGQHNVTVAWQLPPEQEDSRSLVTHRLPCQIAFHSLPAATVAEQIRGHRPLIMTNAARKKSCRLRMGSQLLGHKLYCLVNRSLK